MTIIVDSSVWIASFRGESTQATVKLEAVNPRELILIGDIILLEILQGAQDDAHAAKIEDLLQEYLVVPLLNEALARQAAHNYRKLRSLGITIRKSADLIIGTFCIENDCFLLHNDRDFLPMEQHLGLIAA